MHIEGPGPILTCGHGAHTDEQLTECLARQWGVSVPQLVAMLAALVLSHTERAAASTAGVDMTHSLPAPPARACRWCERLLPPGVHHRRTYCPDSECRRLAHNARRVRQR
jgi:hypothetical protein